MSDKRQQTIFRNAAPDKPYSMILNKMLQDELLTPAAGWVLAYMLSQPPDWGFNLKNVAAKRNMGLDRVQLAVRELRERQYCKRVDLRGKDGRRKGYEYWFTDEPGSFSDPKREKPVLATEEAPKREKRAPVNPVTYKGTKKRAPRASGRRPTKPAATVETDDERAARAETFVEAMLDAMQPDDREAGREFFMTEYEAAFGGGPLPRRAREDDFMSVAGRAEALLAKIKDAIAPALAAGNHERAEFLVALADSIEAQLDAAVETVARKPRRMVPA